MAGLVFATLFVALLMAVVTAVSLIVGWATAENDRNFGGFVLARCACRS